MNVPLRLRLAAWHTASLGVLLVAFAAGTYTYFARSSLNTLDRELTESLAAFRAGAQPEDLQDGADSQIREAAENFQAPAQILVFASNTKLLAATRADSRHPAPPAVEVARAVQNHPGERASWTLRTANGRHFRVAAWHTRIGNEPVVLAAVRSLHERGEALETVLLAFTISIPLALLLAGLAGLKLAGRSIAPVIEATEQQRRFMADAAHELRTPVAILRAESDVALLRERSTAEYRDSLQVMHDESVRLSDIVEDVFLLARVDAGQVPLRKQPMQLDELACECVRAVQALAGERHVQVTCSADKPAPYEGDVALLRRLFLNLLDNGIKYSPPGGTVSLRVRKQPDEYQVAVHNTGPAIGREFRGQLFERFYRPADGSNHPAGAGLGLAIARWIAQAHNGTLGLSDAVTDGNEFVITFRKES